MRRSLVLSPSPHLFAYAFAILLITGLLLAAVFQNVYLVRPDDSAPVPETVAAENSPAPAPRKRGTVVPVVPADAEPLSVELPPIEGVEEAVMTYAPAVPPPTGRNRAARVVVRLTVEEKTMELAGGVAYRFWTFGGETPGPMIRVREGDLIEFHLEKLSHNNMPHNIDLHAVTGPGGGAEATLVTPGQEATVTFRALKPGLYVYHCAMPPVGLHIANGMYGLILVEPEEGLPPVDREYYVLQSEFYTAGAFGEEGLQPFARQKALAEEPSYVVFNGEVGALTGEHALKAAVGETARLYVGNAGPNLTASFHVIGEILDVVHGEGGTPVTQHNVQTTSIPAGGAAVVAFDVEVPGTYVLVDHAIFRAMTKGAVGHLQVVGPEQPEIFASQPALAGTP